MRSSATELYALALSSNACERGWQRGGGGGSQGGSEGGGVCVSEGGWGGWGGVKMSKPEDLSCDYSLHVDYVVVV